MKRLYESLRTCAKEEEVKAEFCKFFKMKIFALRGIDHYAEHILFECKYDRNFRNPESVARVLAQTMYYARLLKYGAGLTKYPLPPYICVVDKNEAFFAETKDYAKFYSAKGDSYEWDRAPSTPRPRLAEDIFEFLTQRHRDTKDCSQMTNGTIVHKSQMANICIGDNGGNCEQLRFVNNQLGLSPESRAVLAAARALYREFYANITAALRSAHDTLRSKLLPQIYSFGFLNPDVEYFT